MTAITVVGLSLTLGICLNALGAAPLELRLWPGKAPGSENWSILESITDRSGSRIVSNVSDPTLTAYIPDKSKSTAPLLSSRPEEPCRRCPSTPKGQRWPSG